MVFSVVMPVYGVERYLRTAVDSVLAQTFEDFELILVDDCSPDNCPAICDEYAAKDSRVSVIHKPQNEGLGRARNSGLQAARGEYVLFVDSDDSISRLLLEKAYEAAGTAQVVVFGFVSDYENKFGTSTWAEALSPPDMHISRAEDMGQAFVALSRARVFAYAWNKIYRRDFLETCGVLFETTELIEDFLFNIAVFEHVSELRCIPNTLYYYRHPAHETLASRYSRWFFDLAKRKYLLEKSFLIKKQAYTAENAQFLMKGYIKHLISAFVRNRSRKSGLSVLRQLSAMRQMLRDELTQAVLHNYVPKGLWRPVCFILKKGRVRLCWVMASIWSGMHRLKAAIRRGL